jgi:hypothetical protein
MTRADGSFGRYFHNNLIQLSDLSYAVTATYICQCLSGLTWTQSRLIAASQVHSKAWHGFGEGGCHIAMKVIFRVADALLVALSGNLPQAKLEWFPAAECGT